MWKTHSEDDGESVFDKRNDQVGREYLSLFEKE